MPDDVAPEDWALTVADAVCLFDVSPPWLNRVLSGERRRVLRAVDGVSFTVRRGATFSVVGESGCGKSTLARMIVGLQPPTAGTLRFTGNPRVQMIFQDPYASLNPRWRVRDIVAEPIVAHGLAPDTRALAARVAELLTQVGLAPEDGERFPHEFSGGQRQRLSLARALLGEPKVLLLDEATSALDAPTQAAVTRTLEQLSITRIAIAHRLSTIESADQIAVIIGGKVAELGTYSELRGLTGGYLNRA